MAEATVKALFSRFFELTINELFTARLNLQKAYELRLAEELAGEEIQKTIQPRSSNNQQLVQV